MSRKSVWIGAAALAVVAVGIGLYVGLSDRQPNSAPYENPVFKPVLADPSILKAKDGYYYAYGTEDDWGDGSGDHLVPIVRSPNLTEWEFVRDAFETKPGWKEDGGLWAPDVSLHDDGKYYMYYSISLWGDPDPGIGVATSDKPEGPFQDQGKLFTSEEVGVENSIDPYYYKDDDGKAYLFWGSFHGIFGIELSVDGLHTVGEKFPVADRQYEAPYIVKRDGHYYFFGSNGTCCNGAYSTYNVKIGRADSIRGPYADKEGIDLLAYGGTMLLAENPDKDKNGKQFVGPGHNAVIADDDGNDWIVYHAIDADDPTLMNGASRRPMMIDPLVWKSGWPAVKGEQPGTASKPGPVVKDSNR